MKDQYVGDVNDYVKYGVWRRLSAGGGLSSALIWMRTPDDERSDGGRKGYLRHAAKWRRYDPELFDVLHALVRSGEAGIEAIEHASILPGCRYLSRFVPSDRDEREEYFAQAAEICRDAKIVFLDPDNGLEVRSTRQGASGSERYVYYHELEMLYSQGLSLVVYQHFPRVERQSYLSSRFDELARSLGAESVQALSTPHVAHLLIPRAEHRHELSQRARDAAAAWSGALKHWRSSGGEGAKGKRAAPVSSSHRIGDAS